MSEGGGSILGTEEDDGNGGSISETAEDNGRCRSATDDSRRQQEWRKLSEDGGSTYYNRVFGGQAEVMRITGL